jgi:hypothetical protein
MSRYNGPPITLGNAATAHVRLIVWCLDCWHQVEPDPAEQATRYGGEMTVPDRHKRLVCSQCGAAGSISSSPASGDAHDVCRWDERRPQSARWRSLSASICARNGTTASRLSVPMS